MGAVSVEPDPVRSAAQGAARPVDDEDLLANLVCASLFLPIALTASSLAQRLNHQDTALGWPGQWFTFTCFLLIAIGGLFAVVKYFMMARRERESEVVWSCFLGLGFLVSVTALQWGSRLVMCASLAAAVAFAAGSVLRLYGRLWRGDSRWMVFVFVSAPFVFAELYLFARAWRQ